LWIDPIWSEGPEVAYSVEKLAGLEALGRLDLVKEPLRFVGFLLGGNSFAGS
jgi:hypothetical protein